MQRLLTSIVLIGLFASGCGSGSAPPTTGPLPILGPDTPAMVAYNLELSFNKRDTNLYKQCLSPNFTFIFNPAEVGEVVGDGYIIPESWGYEEDWSATQNMFIEAYDISFQILENDIGEPADGATTYLAEDIPINLLVMIDPDNGFLAQGTCDFRFETYESNGKTYWRIKDWWDGTGGKTLEPASIGYIKTYFAEKD